MKRFLIPFLLLLALLPVTAQTVRQTGYVRTVGRPSNRQGTRLPGALLRVSGQHNAVQSGKQGAFSLVFNNAQAGHTSFAFTSVNLRGYELNEREMLGRRFAVSPDVPVEVVMVSQQERRDIEERVRAQVELRYQKKLRQIEAQKAQLGERYQKELARLEAEYERRDRLVADMVDRYASTDYAHLDSLSATVNAYIESGELERADSIINGLGIARLEQEHAQLKAGNVQTRAQLAKGEEAERAAAGQLEMAYEAKFNILSTKFENDSAAYYLDRLVALDSTNVARLRQAAMFYTHYSVNFTKALRYIRRAYECCLAAGNGETVQAIHCLIELSIVQERTDSLDAAQATNQQAYELAVRLLGENDNVTARILNNIGYNYSQRGDFDEARACYEKSADIYRTNVGEDSEQMAIAYNNIANMLSQRGNYAEALEVMLKVQDIFRKNDGEMSREVAFNYNNVGTLLGKLGRYDESLASHQKSLGILRHIYKDGHPQTASTLANIGATFTLLDNTDSALVYQREALAMAERFYASDSPHLLQHLNGLAHLLGETGHTAEAEKYFARSIDIAGTSLGKAHPYMATLYNNLASMLENEGRHDEALAYYHQSLDIRRKRLGDNHPDVAVCHNNIGYALMHKHDYEGALASFGQARSIFVKRLGAMHPNSVSIGTNMAILYDSLGREAEAVPLYRQALAYEHSLRQQRPAMLIQLNYALYTDYTALAQRHPQEWTDSLTAFMAGKAIVGYVQGGSAAAQRGLKSPLVTLAYGNWRTGSATSFYAELQRLRQGRRTLAVFTPEGTVRTETFDGTMGVNFHIEPVAPDLLRRATDAWHAATPR